MTENLITVHAYLAPDNLNIKFRDAPIEYLRAVKEYFSEFTANYQFDPRYKYSAWDGKVSLFDGRRRSLPYGLLIDLIKFHRENYPSYRLKIDELLKRKFGDFSVPLEPKFDLKLHPHDYQEEAIKLCLRWRSGIIRVATAGGKSLIIAYILKTLRENKIAKSQIIVVPTLGLIAQFVSDLIDYGIPEKLIGRVDGTNKEFDKPIVVATWQTLVNNYGELKKYQTVIIDEVHSCAAPVIRSVLTNAKNALFRIGFTGTLNENPLDVLNVKSFLGPVLLDASSAELADRGHISKCTINIIDIEYKTEFDGSYGEVRDAVFTNSFRSLFVNELVNKIPGNVLILVGLVKKEGEVLEKQLKESFPDKVVVFLSGKDKVEEREFWRKRMAGDTLEQHIVLVATYQIFQLGINIPSLKHIIFAAPFKSKIRVLQSIGRALRKHVSKEQTGAQIYDLVDNIKYFKMQGDTRIRHYIKEGFDIKEYSINEQDIYSYIDWNSVLDY